MNEPNLEKVLMVILYKVNESGCKIYKSRTDLDERYGSWSNSHGPYTNEIEAKKKKKEVLRKIDGIKRTANIEYTVDIEKLLIPESELIIRNGNYYSIKNMKKL